MLQENFCFELDFIFLIIRFNNLNSLIVTALGVILNLSLITLDVFIFVIPLITCSGFFGFIMANNNYWIDQQLVEIMPPMPVRLYKGMIWVKLVC